MEQPVSVSRFDTRQIGARLPARGRRVPRPPSQSRPDFQPVALAQPPLHNGLQHYAQRAKKLCPAEFLIGPGPDDYRFGVSIGATGIYAKIHPEQTSVSSPNADLAFP